MIAEHRTLEKFEDSLRHCINSYVDGDCDLDTILNAADKVACYKANVGINAKRLPHNEREMAFYEQWKQENAPVAGVNCGHGILQDLFIETGDLMEFNRKVIEEINNRDRMIVATVIQWLGSNCGMCFLEEALQKFGARITYDKKS